MEMEKQSIQKMGTWEYVNIPKGKTAISAKWIYKTKKDGNGNTLKFKARLVVRGNEQEEGVDYFDTYAPMVRWETVKAVLATAAMRNWKVFHLDVKTAFLNGFLKETIYMTIPPGFETAENQGKVCLLKRALYGLKQAPCSWYSRIDNTLLHLKLIKSTTDYNMYLAVRKGKLTIILLYVDDLLVTGDDKEEVMRIKTELITQFDMTDLGEVQMYLGAEVIKNQAGIWLHQRRYILQTLEKFGMSHCRPTKIPMDPGTLLKIDMKSPPCDANMYRAMVGCMRWITTTRYDIKYSVGCCSRYAASP
jgi:hypothetical protein